MRMYFIKLTGRGMKKMKDKKLIIFDLDGTLVYTLDSLQISVNRALQRLGVDGSITTEQCREFIGNGVQVLVEKSLLAVVADAPMEMQKQALKYFQEEFAVYGTYQVVPYEGIVEVLADRKAKGYLLAVLTNKPQVQAVEVVEELFGAGTFDLIQGQVDGFPKKPEPQSIWNVIDKLGCTRENSILIGDSEVDIQTGKNAQIYTIGVAWGYRDRSVLVRERADAIVEHASQLIEEIEKA